jgi:hypothetical protein
MQKSLLLGLALAAVSSSQILGSDLDFTHPIFHTPSLDDSSLSKYFGKLSSPLPL